MIDFRTPAAIVHFILISVAIAGASATAEAQHGDRRNAATWYLRAIERLDDLPQATRFELGSWDSSMPITPEVRSMLDEVRPILDLAHQGASQDYSDMNLDYDAGPSLPLPHLNGLRTIARLMRADAHVRLVDGDGAAAAHIVGDMYRMSEHVSQDSFLIGTLVGMAVFRLTDDVAQFGMDRGLYSQTDSAILLEAADDLDASNPFHVMESIELENSQFVGWFVEQYSGEGGFDAAVTDLPQWLGVGGLDLAVLAGEIGTQEALDADLQKLQESMDFVEETVFTAESFEQAQHELKEWEKRLESGEYGVLAKLLLPSIDRVLDSAIDSQDRIARRRVQLRKLVSGELQPMDAANAAAWYVRALDALDKIPADELRSLRGVEASRAGEESPGDAQLQAHHAALLERAQPIIEILRQASQVQRCDFAGVRPNEPVPSITPSWLPGMRELARLVRADAARLEESDDHDQAAARPDIPLCMSAHLAQGKSIAESVTAHAIMNEAATRVNALLDSGKLSDESRRALARAAAKLESRDALGFNAAVAADRESLARAITVDGRRGEMPEVESFRREKLDPLNADQIVYAIAVWERVQAIKAEEVKARTAALKQQAEAAQNQDQPQPPPQHALPGVQTTIELPDFDPANRLEDVIDRAVLEQVWQAAQHVIESVKRGEIPSGNDLPIILDAASRSRQAAADVQRLLKTVESEIAKVEKSKVESRKEGKRY